MSELGISLYLFLWQNTSCFQKKIQARENEVYGRKAKEKEIEKEIEKRQENKIKNTDDL